MARAPHLQQDEQRHARHGIDQSDWHRLSEASLLVLLSFRRNDGHLPAALLNRFVCRAIDTATVEPNALLRDLYTHTISHIETDLATLAHCPMGSPLQLLKQRLALAEKMMARQEYQRWLSSLQGIAYMLAGTRSLGERLLGAPTSHPIQASEISALLFNAAQDDQDWQMAA